MNWLKIMNSPPPAKLPSRAEFDRKVAQFRKANGITETYRVGFTCAHTLQAYEMVFERAGPGEAFAIVSMAAASPAKAVARFGELPPRRVLDLSEFDWTAWRCPGCQASSFVACGCGQINCDAHRQRRGEAHGLYKCEPGCGYEAGPSPLVTLSATEGGANKARRALPAAGVHLLLSGK